MARRFPPKKIEPKEPAEQIRLREEFQQALSQTDHETRKRILSEVCDRATVKLVRKKILKDTK